MDAAMKTIIELHDKLARRVRAEAALRGCKLEELIEEGLRLVLESPWQARAKAPRSTLHDLMKGVCGIVDSGVPDLASNPTHMRDFDPAVAGHR
jgi:hypothetical protein